MDQSIVRFVDRRGTNSLKWDFLRRNYGREDLLSMWVADMDFRCPDCVNEAMTDYMENGVYGYATLDGRFIDAFEKWEKDVHNYEVDPKWVRFSPGVVSGIYWAIQALTEEKDAVMVMSPVYYPFFYAIEDLDRTLVESQLAWIDDHYEMDFADIEEQIKSKDVKLLVFCSPHNPVGRVWTEDELKKLKAICERYGVIILSDEIHQDIIMSKHHQTPFGTLTSDNLIILTAPSKTFNLAGLKNSSVVIPDDKLRKKWDAFVKKISERGANSMAYIAGEAAYLKGREWNLAVCEIVEDNFIYLR
ncbi:MAG: aminotransferase class I/II-fold pyridoxal phosphate-dependent enzyme, partial [Lachnospiraceae bacterium]|nr:aminotransferase class I/II-fold pyridoxal phosphate-dependent enzyme [Candidatus Equihabitans merdae]